MNTLSRSVLAALVLVTAAPGVARAQSRFVNGMVVTSPESLTAQDKEMLALANEVGRRFVETMEKWLAAKEVTPERLFSFLYYPMVNTDPPKFTTDYDKLSDREAGGGFVDIQESIYNRQPSVIIYTVTVDKNGYLPTHNKRYSMPLTGNLASDLVNNRTKRIFNDRTGLTAAVNTAPFLIQNYQRDTGETMADLSVPLFVQGKHWGAIRIGYRRAETAAR